MVLFLKNLLFTIVVPGTVSVYLPLWIAGSRAPASGWMLVPAFAILAAGAGIYVWCVWDFAVTGRATPAPIDAPKKLVVRGLYRYMRNPMYVGALSAILGWAVFFLAPIVALYGMFVGVCFHSFIVFYEEPRLVREFGTAYSEYRSRVGRWLPRPPRHQK